MSEGDAAQVEARRIARRRRDEWARRRSVAGIAATAPTEWARSEQPAFSGSKWSVDVAAVERHRIVRGWSRLDLAAAARVDPKTLRNLLGRRRQPNLGTVQAVSVALGLTLADLITFA